MKPSLVPLPFFARSLGPVGRAGSRKLSGALAQTIDRCLRWRVTPRAAFVWVGVWAVYSLAMLAFFAYDAAWAASLCGVR